MKINVLIMGVIALASFGVVVADEFKVEPITMIEPIETVAIDELLEKDYALRRQIEELALFRSVGDRNTKIELYTQLENKAEVEEMLQKEEWATFEEIVGIPDLSEDIIDIIKGLEAIQEKYTEECQKIYMKQNVYMNIQRRFDMVEEGIYITFEIPNIGIKPSIYQTINENIGGEGYYLSDIMQGNQVTQMLYSDLVNVSEWSQTQMDDKIIVGKPSVDIALEEKEGQIVNMSFMVTKRHSKGNQVQLETYQKDMIKRALREIKADEAYATIESHITAEYKEEMRAVKEVVGDYEIVYSAYKEQDNPNVYMRIELSRR